MPASADKIFESTDVVAASLSRQAREVVVELEQHVDVDADELDAHPVLRAAHRTTAGSVNT